MNRTCGNHTAPELRLCTSSMPSSCDCGGSHTAVCSENLMVVAAGTKPNFWTRALGVAKDSHAIDAFCAAKLKTAATYVFFTVPACQVSLTMDRPGAVRRPRSSKAPLSGWNRSLLLASCGSQRRRCCEHLREMSEGAWHSIAPGTGADRKTPSWLSDTTSAAATSTRRSPRVRKSASRRSFSRAYCQKGMGTTR